MYIARNQPRATRRAGLGTALAIPLASEETRMKRVVSLRARAAALLAVLAGIARAAPPAPELATAATVKEAQAGRLSVEDSQGSYTVVADAQTVVEKNGAQIAI